MLYLSEELQAELKHFPKLKTHVESFILNDGISERGPLYLTNLTIFIRKLGINIVKLFGWKDKEDERGYNIVEDFYSWGHNSRWAEVVEPYVYYHLEEVVCKILKRLQKRKTNKFI